jgi:hypothetical protein
LELTVSGKTADIPPGVSKDDAVAISFGNIASVGHLKALTANDQLLVSQGSVRIRPRDVSLMGFI